LEIDHLITKRVNIKPNIGLPDIGFNVVDTPKVKPSSVKIRGPKSILSKLQFINTDEIKIKGEQTNFTIEVPLKTNSPLIKILSDDEVVKITINIQETIIEKEFKDLGISIIDIENKNYKILASQSVDLLFEGPYSKIKELSSEDIRVTASAKNITLKRGSKHKLSLQVDYPNKEDIRLERITPITIDIQIK